MLRVSTQTSTAMVSTSYVRSRPKAAERSTRRFDSEETSTGEPQLLRSNCLACYAHCHAQAESRGSSAHYLDVHGPVGGPADEEPGWRFLRPQLALHCLEVPGLQLLLLRAASQEEIGR